MLLTSDTQDSLLRTGCDNKTGTRLRCESDIFVIAGTTEFQRHFLFTNGTVSSTVSWHASKGFRPSFRCSGSPRHHWRLGAGGVQN